MLNGDIWYFVGIQYMIVLAFSFRIHIPNKTLQTICQFLCL